MQESTVHEQIVMPAEVMQLIPKDISAEERKSFELAVFAHKQNNI